MVFDSGLGPLRLTRCLCIPEVVEATHEARLRAFEGHQCLLKKHFIGPKTETINLLGGTEKKGTLSDAGLLI